MPSSDPANESVVTGASRGCTAGAANWLGLAAAPIFAAMALLTVCDAGAEMICSSTSGIFPFGGMATMYLLMCIFHLAPWLRLLGRPQPSSPRNQAMPMP